MALTNKQKRFCDEYLIDFNATQVAIRAGYRLKISPCDRFFVYLLIDPRNEQIFYIGKGTKKRPYHHLVESNRKGKINRFKTNRISDILGSGYEVDIYYFETNLNEQQAFRLEHEIIKHIGTVNLTNISGGIKKATAREEALYALSRIMPFDQWLIKRADATDFEKSLYFKVIDAYREIAEHGYVYAIEQTIINGIRETKEKIRY